MKAMDEKHLREQYGIDHDDWEKTPVSLRRIVLLLGSRIEELEGHLKEIKDLKEQLNEKVRSGVGIFGVSSVSAGGSMEH